MRSSAADFSPTRPRVAASLRPRVNRLTTPRLPQTLETTAYFAVSEALGNVAERSRARQARVTLSARPGKVVVKVITEAAAGKHIGNIFAKFGLPPTQDVNRRVLAVLTYLRIP